MLFSVPAQSLLSGFYFPVDGWVGMNRDLKRKTCNEFGVKSYFFFLTYFVKKEIGVFKF